MGRFKKVDGAPPRDARRRPLQRDAAADAAEIAAFDAMMATDAFHAYPRFARRGARLPAVFPGIPGDRPGTLAITIN